MFFLKKIYKRKLEEKNCPKNFNEIVFEQTKILQKKISSNNNIFLKKIINSFEIHRTLIEKI